MLTITQGKERRKNVVKKLLFSDLEFGPFEYTKELHVRPCINVLEADIIKVDNVLDRGLRADNTRYN